MQIVFVGKVQSKHHLDVGIRTNGMWAAIRMAHKNQKTHTHTTTRGQKTRRHTNTRGGCRQHIGADTMRTRKAIAAE